MSDKLFIRQEPEPMQIFRSLPAGPPPTGPIEKCLECGNEFVWWLHPVQLCAACVEVEMAKATESINAEETQADNHQGA